MKKDKTVYLVDDDEDDLFLLRQALESVLPDICITEITDGRQLIELVGKQDILQNPALILMDMNMQRMDGIEAVCHLKANPRTHNIPVVMISTSNDERLIRGAYHEGVSAFMIKPESQSEYKNIAEAISVCFLKKLSNQEELTVLTSFKDKSVLIVECDDSKWAYTKQAFKKDLPDLHIIRTCNRNDTLDFLTDEWFNLPKPPELIIFDLYLPTRQEGLGLLDSIRYFFLFHSLPFVPIVILSHSDHIEDINLSYEHNANAFITKSKDFNQSLSGFRKLCHFWCNLIALPKSC